MKFAHLSVGLAIAFTALTACTSSSFRQDAIESSDVSTAASGGTAPKSVTISISGEVRRPGIYHLAAGAVVRDAFEAAQGFTDFRWWYASHLTRPADSGESQVISFRGYRRDPQKVDMIPLRDGDQIYIGREVW